MWLSFRHIMMELVSYIPYLVASSVFIAATFCIIKFFQFSKRLNLLATQLSGVEVLLSDLQDEIANVSSKLEHDLGKQNEWQVEQEQVSGQLTHRTNTIKESIKALKEEIAELQQQQPEDKLYSRAQKMVKLGADVDELVSECQLPRIEAEMLIAMHKRKSNS